MRGHGQLQARIPVSRRHQPGQVVEVLYVPDDPTRVRTAKHWRPAYLDTRTLVALVLTGVLLFLELRSARRQRCSPAGKAS